MTRRNLSVGSSANDGTGDTLRQAGIKINQNFVEIYQKLGGDSNALMPGITFDSEGIIFEGNIDSFETRLIVESPTADRTVTIPNYTGELVIDSDTQTLKNKTLVDPNLIHPDLYDSENATYFTAFKPFSASGMSKNINLNIPTLTDSDTLVTLTSTATLTNKTLTTPIISSISNTGTLTLPTSTDTLVGRATTDTLTNKTLTSPQIGTDIRLNAQAELEFYDSDSSHYVSFRAPATITSSLTWTLPASDGTADQVLATDGSGTLSWADAGSGGGSGSSYPNSTFTTVPGTNGNFDMSYNVAQTVQETPFEASGTDAFGVNLGSVFSLMDPVGTTESIDYGSGEAYVGA